MSVSYRLQHTPTGLFYGRRKIVDGVPTNLHKKGTTFPNLPSLSVMGGVIESHLHGRIFIVENDWKIVEFHYDPS